MTDRRKRNKQWKLKQLFIKCLLDISFVVSALPPWPNVIPLNFLRKGSISFILLKLQELCALPKITHLVNGCAKTKTQVSRTLKQCFPNFNGSADHTGIHYDGNLDSVSLRSCMYSTLLVMLMLLVMERHLEKHWSILALLRACKSSEDLVKKMQIPIYQGWDGTWDSAFFASSSDPAWTVFWSAKLWCAMSSNCILEIEARDGSQSFLLTADSFQLLTFADNDYATMWYLKLPLKNNKNPSLV